MVLLTLPCLFLSAGMHHLPRDGAGGILQVTPDEPVNADGQARPSLPGKPMMPFPSLAHPYVNYY